MYTVFDKERRECVGLYVYGGVAVCVLQGYLSNQGGKEESHVDHLEIQNKRPVW